MWRALVIVLAVLTPGSSVPAQEGPSPPGPTELVRERLPVDVSPPLVALDGLRTKLSVAATGRLPEPEVRVEIRDSSGRSLGDGWLRAGSTTEIFIVLPRGHHRLSLHMPDHYAGSVPFELRAIPPWLTVVPPFLAILLALLFRQVVPALLAGIWLGAWIGYGELLGSFLRTLDTYLLGALADADHVSIVVFSVLLGGMVGVISRSGGTRGLVEALARGATTSRLGQLVTWVLGTLIFFDDYANTLVVGNTMRPVTDRLRVSREKLAYIVDSTAAPVAAVALISTWIGFEVSLIGDALDAVGSKRDAYTVFLQSIPYSFYPILTLAFGFMVALSRRDFGPMLRAERRAAAGKLIGDKAVPLTDFDNPALMPPDDKPRRWVNAVAPVLAVLVVAFLGQLFTGRASLAAEGDPLASVGFLGLGLQGFGRVFSSGNSFHALLYGASCGCLVAIVLARAQRILRLGDGIRAWLEGMKTMVLAVVILTLAWAIGKVCVDLNTAGFVVSALSGRLDPRILPALVFVFAALISFATGTSWGTMSILIPLAVPGAYGVAEAAGYDPGDVHRILLGAVSSVLAGAIFGDHCSPISDTTIMSSMSSGCDHVDHVKTQLPYALLVAVVGTALGSLPCAYGLSPWISIVAGAAALWGVLRLLGRPVSVG